MNDYLEQNVEILSDHYVQEIQILIRGRNVEFTGERKDIKMLFYSSRIPM